jgi:hypothetical protein
MSLSALFVLRRRAATCLFETSHGAEATFLSARHIPQGRYPSTSASTPVFSTHSILKNPHFPRISRWKNATQITPALPGTDQPGRCAPGASVALRRHSYHRGIFLKVMTRRPQLPHWQNITICQKSISLSKALIPESKSSKNSNLRGQKE